MQSNATVTIDELDAAGHTWRTSTSQMVRTNVEQSLAAIRAGYNMNHTRIKVDGQIVVEPRRPLRRGCPSPRAVQPPSS